MFKMRRIESNAKPLTNDYNRINQISCVAFIAYLSFDQEEYDLLVSFVQQYYQRMTVYNMQL